jgi:hypothetical protein
MDSELEEALDWEMDEIESDAETEAAQGEEEEKRHYQGGASP